MAGATLCPLVKVRMKAAMRFPVAARRLRTTLTGVKVSKGQCDRIFFADFSDSILKLCSCLCRYRGVSRLGRLNRTLLRMQSGNKLRAFRTTLILKGRAEDIGSLVGLARGLSLCHFCPSVSSSRKLNHLCTSRLKAVSVPRRVRGCFSCRTCKQSIHVGRNNMFTPNKCISTIPRNFGRCCRKPRSVPPRRQVFTCPRGTRPIRSVLTALGQFRRTPPTPGGSGTKPSRRRQWSFKPT